MDRTVVTILCPITRWRTMTMIHSETQEFSKAEFPTVDRILHIRIHYGFDLCHSFTKAKQHEAFHGPSSSIREHVWRQ